MADRGWQVWWIGGIGLWLIASPFFPLFRAEMASDMTVSFIAAGVLQIFLAFGLIAAPEAWKRWGLVIIGLAVLALPWGMGFDKTVYAVWNAAVAGGLTFVLAVWTLITADTSNAV